MVSDAQPCVPRCAAAQVDTITLSGQGTALDRRSTGSESSFGRFRILFVTGNAASVGHCGVVVDLRPGHLLLVNPDETLAFSDTRPGAETTVQQLSFPVDVLADIAMGLSFCPSFHPRFDQHLVCEVGAAAMVADLCRHLMESPNSRVTEAIFTGGMISLLDRYGTTRSAMVPAAAEPISIGRPSVAMPVVRALLPQAPEGVSAKVPAVAP